MTHRLLPGLLGTAALLAISLAASGAHAIEFKVTNLVSDGTVPAANTDTRLINPWGVSYAPQGPFWVSDNGKGLVTLYTGTGANFPPLQQVVIPPDGAAPTGQVFNAGLGAGAFQIGGKTPAFLFDGEDGHITGWAPSMGGSAQVGFTASNDAVFKGLATISSGGNTMLYATDFHNDAVDVFTNSLTSGFTSFTDPTVAPGYAPFGAQMLNGQLYVTFALQNAEKHDDVGGPGNGYVDVFNLDGTLNHRVASLGGEINSPWGLALAPSSWGVFAGKLLVGNFGDGTISVFDPGGGGFMGKLRGTDGKPLEFGDLWALTPGNGFLAGDTQKIYLTAGLSDEAHGLFASLTAVPEPGAWMLLITGFGVAGAALRARRRTASADA
jgi:uncharacterized protein (TIGR03118 family)